MNYHVFPLFPRDHRDIPYWQTEDKRYSIYAKDQKDIPDWLKVHHQWDPAFDVNKLQKHQLKVKMCCAKCQEILVEMIREVRGVFDVRAERLEKKVVVVAMPSGINEHEVLRKARKVHKKARYVELDAKERQKPKGENKGKDGHGHGQGHDSDHHHGHDNDSKGGHGQKKGGKQIQSVPASSVPGVAQFPWGQQFFPIQSMAPSYYYQAPPRIQGYPDPQARYVSFL